MRPTKRARSSPSSPSSNTQQQQRAPTSSSSPATSTASNAITTPHSPRGDEAAATTPRTTSSPKGKERQLAEVKADNRPATPPSKRSASSNDGTTSPSRRVAKHSSLQPTAASRSPSSTTTTTSPSSTASPSSPSHTADGLSSGTTPSSSSPTATSPGSSSSSNSQRTSNRSPVSSANTKAVYDHENVNNVASTSTNASAHASTSNTNPSSPQSPTARMINQVIRRTSNEGSPVRSIGAAAVASTSPGELVTEQQQKKPSTGSTATLSLEEQTGQLVEQRDVEALELINELTSTSANSSLDSEHEEGEEADVILTHGGQQVSVKIPQPLLLTSTIARGSFHQCGTARRVKVYRLEGETWIDNGTGYCAGVYDEVHDEALLVARVEDSCIMIDGAAPDPRKQVDKQMDPLLSNGAISAEAVGIDPTAASLAQPYYLIVSEDMNVDENIMLNTQVVKEDVYQKQQDTLVVWTESDGTDMALSFQEADGCQEVWEFITEVQRHFLANQAASNSVAALSDSPTPDAGSPTSGGDLSQSNWGMGSVMFIDSSAFNPPDPSLGKLEDIEQMLKEAAAKGPVAREKVAEWLVRADYLRKLVPVFQDAEDLENAEDLQCLCSIIQTIVMLNDSAIIETIIQDDLFVDIAGMFEYDPEFPLLKASYRDYLRKTARFKTVVDIDDPKIVTKIHQVYRLQYLKDVILARILDDAMFSVLNSWIFFHQVDIVNYCASNVILLRRIFSVCAPDSQEAEERKHDAVFFVQSLCVMGKQVQMPVRINLYRSLADNGILLLLEYSLFESDRQRVRNAAAEMLLVLVEFDPSIIRNYTLEQDDRQQKTFVSRLSDLLHSATDLGLKAQMAEVLRTIFDYPPPETVNQTLTGAAAAAAAARSKVDPERFFAHLYETDIDRLFSPLKRLPDYKTLNLATVRFTLPSRENSALLAHLCELLCNCVLQHGFRSQYFVITSEIAVHIATLLFAKEKYIKLAAIKLFRACLASNNQFINRHFLKHGIFGALLLLATREGCRDNLILSACIEFFEHLKKEKSKNVIESLAERNLSRLEELASNPYAGACFSSLLEMARKPVSLRPGQGGEEANTNANAEPQSKVQFGLRFGSRNRGGPVSSSSSSNTVGSPSSSTSSRKSTGQGGGGNGIGVGGRPSFRDEEEEEDAYFEASDEDEMEAAQSASVTASSSTALSAQTKPAGTAPSVTSKSSTTSTTPSLSSSFSSPSGLAGIGMYSDDDEEDEGEVEAKTDRKEDPPPLGLGKASRKSSDALTSTAAKDEQGRSSSPPQLLSHDNNDNPPLVEAGSSEPDSLSLPLSATNRASEKRRREEAEEEGMGLERLAKKRSQAEALGVGEREASGQSHPKMEGKAERRGSLGGPAAAGGGGIGPGGGFLPVEGQEQEEETQSETHEDVGKPGSQETSKHPTPVPERRHPSTALTGPLEEEGTRTDSISTGTPIPSPTGTGSGSGSGTGTGSATATNNGGVKKISLGLSKEARKMVSVSSLEPSFSSSNDDDDDDDGSASASVDGGVEGVDGEDKDAHG